MKTVRGLVEEFIQDEDEIDEFGRWAFGKYYRTIIDSINFMEAWNILHEKELKLSPAGKMYDDMKKMIELWGNSKKVS